ncbi:hypothetical protein QW060_21780 [Myroides ceti]|uniref:Uncharacterized protein n=1 Tax=Paenimyroides ceti TaxID=395087 RepID=A0ABT8CRL9_9FLAO|nr:hypothetical protein [Paenimyroides ceti]MDN3705850.1 hypothetical protein [Paenimyroides ceti]MDN3709600.1 hypothetical protein [Paenimyroides ceti]
MKLNYILVAVSFAIFGQVTAQNLVNTVVLKPESAIRNYRHLPLLQQKLFL